VLINAQTRRRVDVLSDRNADTLEAWLREHPGMLKDKVRALTNRLSQQPPGDVLIRLNQIMHGWAHYFTHAVCKHTLDNLENIVWHRVIRRWMRLHRWTWRDVRRHLVGPNGRWRRPTADGIANRMKWSLT
jgi:hypothetical protein